MVPARAMAQPRPSFDPDLSTLIDLITQIAAYDDRQFLREDARAFFEARLVALKRMHDDRRPGAA